MVEEGNMHTCLNPHKWEVEKGRYTCRGMIPIQTGLTYINRHRDMVVRCLLNLQKKEQTSKNVVVNLDQNPKHAAQATQQLKLKERGVADQFGFSGFVQAFFQIIGPRSYTLSQDGVDTHMSTYGEISFVRCSTTPAGIY